MIPHKQRANEHRRWRSVDQGKIREQRQSDAEHKHDHGDERQEDDSRNLRQRAEADGDIAAGHHQVAMGEVNRAGRIDDEDKAECDQRVGCAKCQAVDYELKQCNHDRVCERVHFRTISAPV